MGRSQETFSKRDIQNKKDKKRKDKVLKMEQRKQNAKSSFDDMIAYVDEFGRISSTPPDPNAKKNEINAENIEISTAKREDQDVDYVNTGIVTFFNDDKGYGFVKDSDSGMSVFLHAKNILEPIKENQKVTFQISKGPKGLIANDVRVYKAPPKVVEVIAEEETPKEESENTPE